jgi:hypothetical protein
MRIRTILAAAAAPLAIGGVLLTATAASAATGPSQFTTHMSQNPDTTSFTSPVANPVTLSSAQGPVWSFDNLTVKLTPVYQATLKADGANYVVNVDVTGSFHGFADPLTGAPLTSDGSVKGTISYDVFSPQGPNGANLPAQEGAWTVNLNPAPGQNQVSGGQGLGDAITQLMGPGSSIVGGGNVYNFSYQNGNYTQVQPANGTYVQTGDVTGH